jgi:heme exporter protein CcmD
MDQPLHQHLGFIVAAFAVTGVVLAGMIAAVLLDYRAQLQALARLLGRSSSGDIDQ